MLTPGDYAISNFHRTRDAAVLPALGASRFFMVEIPESGTIPEGAREHLEAAEHAFGFWQRKSVFGHCRELGELLDAAVRRQFEKGEFPLEKWTRAYKEYSHLCSIGLHEEDFKAQFQTGTVEITKSDAALVLLMSKALLKYASEVLSRTQP